MITATQDRFQSGVFNAQEASHASFWQSVDSHAAVVRLKMLRQFQGKFIQINAELPNFYASMTWLKSQKEDTSALLLLSYLEILIPYFQSGNRASEAERWCMAGLEANQRLDRNPANILISLGEAQYALGNWDQARTSWQAAAESSGGQESEIYPRAIFCLGRLHINEGNFKLALSMLAQAESVFDELGNHAAALQVRSEIAAYYLNRHELDKALELYLEIDGAARELSGGESSDHSLLMLGVVYRQKKNYKESIWYLSQLYRRGESTNRTSTLATAAHHLAWTYLELGQTEEAHRLCGQAIALYGMIQDPRGLSDGYEQIGAILIRQGEQKKALNYIRRSFTMRRQLRNRPGQVSSLRLEAFAQLKDGKYLSAIILAIRVIFSYYQLKLLSRERLISLARNFMNHLAMNFYGN